jgi:SAM-dependent methyltransferase
MNSELNLLATNLQTAEYLRQRIAPSPGDPFYIPLADLRLSLGAVATKQSIEILDYGSGGSPYRSLFPNAHYRRADLVQSDPDQLDYILTENGQVDEEPEVFDMILSTQVLEHVIDPQLHLAECYRLLKPGGVLYCTTHGIFEDHGVPYDFQRWTSEGLRRDLTRAGFAVVRLEKLTTGPRALMFQLDRHLGLLGASRKTFFGMTIWAMTILISAVRAYIHRQCDRHYRDFRVVPQQCGKFDRQVIYIGLAALGRKPGFKPYR